MNLVIPIIVIVLAVGYLLIRRQSKSGKTTKKE
jgi:preprotein translocase subunit YajC